MSKLKEALLTKGNQLVFIRHGDAGWRRGQGPQNFGLTPIGAENTKQMAKRLYGQFPSLYTIYTSTLNRAEESAQIYARLLGVKVTHVVGIDEYDFSRPECPQAFEKRVVDAFLRMIKNHPDGSPIVVVSHGKVFGNVISMALLGRKERLGWSDVAIFSPRGSELSVKGYSVDGMVFEEEIPNNLPNIISLRP